MASREELLRAARPALEQARFQREYADYSAQRAASQRALEQRLAKIRQSYERREQVKQSFRDLPSAIGRGAISAAQFGVRAGVAGARDFAARAAAGKARRQEGAAVRQPQYAEPKKPGLMARHFPNPLSFFKPRGSQVSAAKKTASYFPNPLSFFKRRR